MNDTTFERLLLKDATARARELGAIVKEGWVYKFSLGGCSSTWEFHYKHNGKKFYWYGDAENAWHAKAQGWEAWILKQTTK